MMKSSFSFSCGSQNRSGQFPSDSQGAYIAPLGVGITGSRIDSGIVESLWEPQGTTGNHHRESPEVVIPATYRDIRTGNHRIHERNRSYVAERNNVSRMVQL